MVNEFLATENLKITNYKPVPGRESNKNDINITNDENGNFKVKDKNHQALVRTLQALDGDTSSLSWEDLSLARSLAGQNGINKVYIDTDAKVARFEFND